MAETAENIETITSKTKPPTVARFGLEAEFNTIWRVNVPVAVSPEQTL